ncbi:15630_t:CDS:2, partial [Racocetra persica]
ITAIITLLYQLAIFLTAFALQTETVDTNKIYRWIECCVTCYLDLNFQPSK